MARLYSVMLLAQIWAVAAASQQSPTVTVDNSLVHGLQSQFDGKPYWAFLGIRYAQAPVAELRFAKPIPELLPLEVNATKHGARCFPMFNDPRAAEDCLFLNVYCPPLSPSQNDQGKAVIFYIHEGGHVMGSGNDRDGTILVTENDVIVVTINYRLGPFGFLSTGDKTAPGNLGFWDQNLALAWVKRNIAQFGGDPDLVTVMGASAGGKDTAMHTLTTRSNTLFKRAIMMSGTMHSPSFYMRDALETARRLATRVKCDTADTALMVDCLRKVPAAMLAGFSMNMWPESLVRTGNDFGWGAIRDGEFVPYDYAPGSFKGEVLLTLNSNEGSLLYDTASFIESKGKAGVKDWYLSTDNFKKHILKGYLEQYFDKPATARAIELASEVYNPDPSKISWKALLDLHADQQYLTSSIRYLKESLSTGQAFVYFFDYDVPKYNHLPKFLHGSHHTDDSKYAFGFKTNENKYDENTWLQEQKASSVLRTYLTNFVKTGNPNSPVQLQVEFPAYTSITENYLQFTHKILQPDVTESDAVRSRLLASRMNLWLEVLPLLMEDKAEMGGASSGVCPAGVKSDGSCIEEEIDSHNKYTVNENRGN